MTKLLDNKILTLVILALGTFIAYFQVTGFEFTNWDDPKLVTENPLIKDLSLDGIKAIFTSHMTIHYKPLVFLSWAVEYHFFGLNPTVFHTTNMLLHIFNTCLVYLVLLQFSGSKPVSFLTALVFGLHPIHAESVAWVTERKDVLYSFFYLLSIRSYQIYKEDEQTKKYLIIAFFLFVGALLSKMMAVTLPVVIILMDRFKEKKWNIEPMIPFFGAIVLPMILFKGFQKAFSYVVSPFDTLGMPFSLADRFVLSGYEIVYYLQRLLVPVNLSPLYEYPKGIDSMHIGSLLLVVATMTGLWVLRKRLPSGTLFGLLWFGVTLFPALQMFLPLGDAITADRYMYMPMAGLFFAIFSFIEHRVGLSDKILFPMSAIGGVVLILMTISQGKIWKDTTTLWSNVLEGDGLNKLALNNRSIAYMKVGRFQEAYKDLTLAIQSDPTYAESFRNRGDVSYELQRYQEAIRDYTQAFNLDPDFYEVLNNRGNSYLMMQQFDLAIADYDRSLEINPRSAEALTNRGIAKLNKQQPREALVDFIYALEIDPN
jgi:hypothetical protein